VTDQKLYRQILLQIIELCFISRSLHQCYRTINLDWTLEISFLARELLIITLEPVTRGNSRPICIKLKLSTFKKKLDNWMDRYTP